MSACAKISIAPEETLTEPAWKTSLLAKGRPGPFTHLHGDYLLTGSRIVSKCGMIGRNDTDFDRATDIVADLI